jgi:hypothetical protein
MAAKYGWLCPRTTEAKNQARLAATAVCKMGQTPVPRRPDASCDQRRNAPDPTFGTTHANAPKFTTKHLLRGSLDTYMRFAYNRD